jgi:hypothetical protein
MIDTLHTIITKLCYFSKVKSLHKNNPEADSE